MSDAQFKHYDLKLLEPKYDSPLVDLIMELEHLRRKPLVGSTEPTVFFQLKHIFHTLESIGSARIEGNNTTILEYIETKIEANSEPTDAMLPSIKEIRNIENAMQFIEEQIKDSPINRMLISEIHRIIVEDLAPPPNGEGDQTPGVYRQKNVKISRSLHLPPDIASIDAYMEELFRFINQSDPLKYDLLKVAIAHHRFVWIHPFLNGNGRTVRLFTYALLVKAGFNVNVGRILNPTAIFCNSRDNYYHNLSLADQGTEDGISNWCIYVLKGLKEEIEKIDKLLDYNFLHKEILIPAINYSLERKLITEFESKILKKVVEKQIIQASDLSDFFPGRAKSEISRNIRMLLERKMLVPEAPGKRKYLISFDNSYLIRGVMHALDQKGFLPDKMM